MAIDLDPLWQFDDPAASERAFLAALASATGDDALILRTQIARTHGLRRDFVTARSILHAIEPAVAAAGAEARVRHRLEFGRTLASATHDPASLTAETKAAARQAFAEARRLAEEARLDDLAIDAIHMEAFLDPAPEAQERCARAALAVVERSDQPRARRWEASVRHNLGYALLQQQRPDEALREFTLARELRAKAGKPGPRRVADWMVARTLRALNRHAEARDIQLRLEREWAADGKPSPYVYDELVHLHRALGDEAQAVRFEALRRALQS